MSPNQIKFFDMLERVEFAKKYWDRGEGTINLEFIEKNLSLLSAGEASMLKFLVGVWLSHNQLGFDFIDDGCNLNGELKQVYYDWVTSPYFP